MRYTGNPDVRTVMQYYGERVIDKNVHQTRVEIVRITQRVSGLILGK